MKALDLYSERVYTPECDKELPESERTTLGYRLLTAEQYAYYQDLVRLGIGTATLAVMHMAMTRCHNLQDGNSGVVEFRRDTSRPQLPGGLHPWHDDCLSRIPAEERDTFAAQVVRESRDVGADAQKKS